jgi:hypothetical protein
MTNSEPTSLTDLHAAETVPELMDVLEILGGADKETTAARLRRLGWSYDEIEKWLGP